ncbi:MAG: hypothetical protein K2L07_13340 [Lachnospiraceae bacterium]|nr:hypothetical protein [Lachnospiraceae bacterium]
MNFTNTIKNEADKKYRNMLNNTSEAPFSSSTEISAQSTYSGKRDRYYGRLNKEKTDYNTALQQIKNNRSRRLSDERNRAIAKARRKYNRWKSVRTVIFLIPLFLCTLIGYDVFNQNHGQMFKIKAMDSGFNFGWTIALYTIFCIISVICSITFIVNMHKNEDYNNGVKRYKVFAILVLIFCIGLSGTNLYFVVGNINNYRLAFKNGNDVEIKYVEKGESISLPKATKEEDEYSRYITRYTFDGWLIDGEIHKAGTKFVPSKNVDMKAQFTSTNWARIQVSCSNATITLKYDGQVKTTSSDQFYVDVVVGTKIDVSVSYDYSGGQSFTVYNAERDVNDKDNSILTTVGTYTSTTDFTLTGHTYISASSYSPSSSGSSSGGGGGCLAEGTLITLFDGSQKPVEELEMGDELVVFNHETGKYDIAPLLTNVHANQAIKPYKVINLGFSDGTTLRIVMEHGLFDKTLNKYVFIREENAADFVGHTFVATDLVDGAMVSRMVTLDSVIITAENTRIFNPVSVWHCNLIANDMLTFSADMVNIFEYDESMQYDFESMAQDIEKYGLYTYEDFEEYIPLELYEAFPVKYYKIAVEKDMYTYDKILWLISMYYDVTTIR